MTFHSNGRGNTDRPVRAVRPVRIVRPLTGHRSRTVTTHASPPPPPSSPPPLLTLVGGRASGARTPVALRDVAGSPMPPGVRGALVTAADSGPGRTFQVSWSSYAAPARIPPGRVRLSWTPAGEDRMDVEAHLGLPGAEVLLARWPGLRGDWSDVVRPTVTEVTELFSALRLATVVLNRLTR